MTDEQQAGRGRFAAARTLILIVTAFGVGWLAASVRTQEPPLSAWEPEEVGLQLPDGFKPLQTIQSLDSSTYPILDIGSAQLGGMRELTVPGGTQAEYYQQAEYYVDLCAFGDAPQLDGQPFVDHIASTRKAASEDKTMSTKTGEQFVDYDIWRLFSGDGIEMYVVEYWMWGSRVTEIHTLTDEHWIRYIAGWR